MKLLVEVWVAGKATVEIEPNPNPDMPWRKNPSTVKEHVLSELQAAARMEERRTGIKLEFVVDHVASHEVKEK
jgi:hypothetical protein